MEDIPSELSKDNLNQFLLNDNAFVDYFNTFLSLPCFPERIFYNKESDLLEQFTQQLVKDESDSVQLKYDLSNNKVQISYCVTVLDKDKAMKWLKKYRLPEFFKSGLYAEYKLSKILSTSQAKYIDAIKEDLSRAKFSDVGSQVYTGSKLTSGENSKCLEDDFLLSDDSVSSVSEKCNSSRRSLNDIGEIEEILNDYGKTNIEKLNHKVSLSSERSLNTSSIANDDEIRDPENVYNVARKSQDVSENNAKYSKIFAENFQAFPSIIVKDTGGNAGCSIQIGKDVSESYVTYADRIKGSSSCSNIGHEKVDDVINLKDSNSDIEVQGDAVDDDVYLTGHDIISNNTSTNEDSRLDLNDQSLECMKSNQYKIQGYIDKFPRSDLDPKQEISAIKEFPSYDENTTEDNFNISDDECDILTTFCDKSHTIKTKGISSSDCIIVADNSTQSQEERSAAEKNVRKDKTKFCKCFLETNIVGSEKIHEEISCTLEKETGLCKISRTSQGTNKSSKESNDITDCTRPSTRKDFSDDTNVDIDNFGGGSESSSLLSKIPVPALTLNTDEQRTFNEKNVPNQTELRESNSDSITFLEQESCTIGSLEVMIPHCDVNIKYDKNVNGFKNCTNGKVNENKMRPEGRNSTTVNNVETLLSNVKLSMAEDIKVEDIKVEDIKVEDINSYNINSKGNIKEKNIQQNSNNPAMVDKLKNLSHVKPLQTDDTASHITVTGRENNLLDTRSLRKRASSLDSIASNDTTVERERKLSIREEEIQIDEETLDNEVNLASKVGMDKFKEFLINTKGEALLLFWLQVETLKHLGNKADKIRVHQEMKEQFLRIGSPLELPNEIKKQAGCLAADLNETQRIIAEPLCCYWCPRFTLHQYKTQTWDKIQTNDHDVKAGQNTQSTEIQSISEAPCLMYPSSSPHLVRPHSSTPREMSNSSSPRETPVGIKTHARSKSTQGRILTTPCHTNAGKKQLEIYATPQAAEYGYQKRPIGTFPPSNDEEYLSSVRLIITPRCKPKLRTAWPQSQEENRNTGEAYIAKSRDNVHHDSLLESLMYQTESGCFFKEFVSKQNNQLWFNCLLFWQAVMDYTACFESDTLNPVTVSRKAQWIYARFITSGSICDIKVNWKIQEDVEKRLEPPYEELFDCVEDHVLKCLKEPWDNLCRNERREYDMIPKKETVRYLEVQLKQTRGRSKNSFLQEELDSQDGREQSEHGKYSIDEANHPLPSPQDGISFESVIKDRDELEGFQKYLEKKDPKGVTDLMAWTDMETFQRIPRTMEEKRNKKAKEIRQGYLNSRYFFGPDSPATKEAQNLILSMNGSLRIKERPSSSVITECQKYVRCRIERRWLALYKASEEYKERQNPTQNVSDVVEDIMLRRRLQRSEAAWRVLNSRWVSSSRDIVALRQTLNNPESCLAFRKFVALKGDTYENDVLFWIEIQKYKDLCHRHASEQCIKKKIQAITECFITSSIPPELQVDVPIEMAEKLMERITSRNQNIGPYLFREVQMTVFRVLFNMWKDFCSFRSSINDEFLLKILDQRLTQHRAEIRAKKEANERKKLAKQEAEKKKKEKEEKEKRELKSMEQLMSLMAENSSLEQEENDVVLWKYSKHMSAISEPALAQKKISIQEDTASFMEVANQRSVATKSTNQITNSLRSERNTRKVPKFKHVSSLLAADSTDSTHSKHSMKATNSTTSRIPRINQSNRNLKARDIKRYDITDKNNPEKKMTDNVSEKKRVVGKNKLLKNRERKKSKMLHDQESLDAASNVERLELVTSQTGNKHHRVKSPGVKDQALKSRKTPTIEHATIRGSDDISMLTERPGSLRTSLLRRQWNQSYDRSGSPVPLTSQRLKDFTNSPEGAPLDSPLSLARINTSDDVSAEKTVNMSRKPAQSSHSRTLQQSNMNWRSKRANLRRSEEQFVPDVIVN